MIERILSVIFPPKLGHVRISYRAGDDFPEDLEDGILWRGYNVKQDAIERHWRSHEMD
jgi:hypothetical protein